MSEITGVDFVMMPTKDLDVAVKFYGEVLGLHRSVYMPERNFAEFETGNLTLSVAVTENFPFGYHPNPNPVALHVDDVPAARAAMEARGAKFTGDTFDTSVCHMAFFSDPDGNAIMLHNRYAPRHPE